VCHSERPVGECGAYTDGAGVAIGFLARLLDGDKALESLSMLMQHSTNIIVRYASCR